MFTKESKITSTVGALENYIKDNDVYNSALLYVLRDPSLGKFSYLIGEKQYRPDLIAEEVYGDAKYSGYVILQSPQGLVGMRKGSILSLIPKSTLMNLINRL